MHSFAEIDPIQVVQTLKTFVVAVGSNYVTAAVVTPDSESPLDYLLFNNDDCVSLVLGVRNGKTDSEVLDKVAGDLNIQREMLVAYEVCI